MPYQLANWVKTNMGIVSLVGGASSAGLLGVTTSQRWILGFAVGNTANSQNVALRLQSVGSLIPLAQLLSWIPGNGLTGMLIPIRSALNDIQITQLELYGIAQTFSYWVMYADAPPNVFSPLNLTPLAGALM